MPRDFSSVLNNSVQVYYPVKLCAGDLVPIPAKHKQTVPLSLLYPNIAGSPSPKLFHERAFALWDTSLPDPTRPGVTNPTNATELTSLSQQVAADYYGWQRTKYDRVYNGVVAFEPEGYLDELCLLYGLGGDGNADCRTRVTSYEYNGYVEELQHATPDEINCCGKTNQLVYVPTVSSNGHDLEFPISYLSLENGDLILCPSGGKDTVPEAIVCCGPGPFSCIVCVFVHAFCLKTPPTDTDLLPDATITVKDANDKTIGACITDGTSQVKSSCVNFFFAGLGPSPTPTTPTTVGLGCCCIGLQDNGDYTITITADNYATQTLKVACRHVIPPLGGPISNPDILATEVTLQPTDLTPKDNYVLNNCCGCAPHGDQPNRINRVLLCTLTGPLGILGPINGIQIPLTLAPDSDDGTGYPNPAKFLHWTSGCLPLGGFYACYDRLGTCGIPLVAGDCSAFFNINVSSWIRNVQYLSSRIDFYQFYPGGLNELTCATMLTYENFTGAGCTTINGDLCRDENPFHFAADSFILDTSPIHCPCGNDQRPHAQFTHFLFKFISIYGIGVENYGGIFDVNNCALVNTSSRLCRPIDNFGCTIDTIDSPGFGPILVAHGAVPAGAIRVLAHIIGG